MPRANIEHAAKQHVAALAIALHNRHVANKRHKLVELKIGVPLRFVAAWRFDDDPLVLRFSEGVGARELHGWRFGSFHDWLCQHEAFRGVEPCDAVLEEARTEIRANAAETDESKRLDLLRKLVARVGYLRIITPKGGRHKREGGTFVVREGELVEDGGESKGKRVADGKISMQEAHDYHNRLMKRQYFGRKPPPQPPML